MMERNNSTIYKNPQDQHIFDLTQLGTIIYAGGSVIVDQQNHYFQIGDVLYYNIKEKKFAKAVAVNNIESEVCGVVSSIKDKDTFVISGDGIIETERYTFDEGAALFLSDVHPGKLVSIPPANVVKQIAIQATNGIIVDIQRGYKTGKTETVEEIEFYTQEELDEIIKNIW